MNGRGEGERGKRGWRGNVRDSSSFQKKRNEGYECFDEIE